MLAHAPELDIPPEQELPGRQRPAEQTSAASAASAAPPFAAAASPASVEGGWLPAGCRLRGPGPSRPREELSPGRTLPAGPHPQSPPDCPGGGQSSLDCEAARISPEERHLELAEGLAESEALPSSRLARPQRGGRAKQTWLLARPQPSFCRTGAHRPARGLQPPPPRSLAGEGHRSDRCRKGPASCQQPGVCSCYQCRRWLCLQTSADLPGAHRPARGGRAPPLGSSPRRHLHP
mmetsp:Transcript_1056/g.3195  ORF Transcript_1056/g.3195 Transcript_1056/m.3195 type:complete len:235 (-) Transcript_1056:927-1631(-)